MGRRISTWLLTTLTVLAAPSLQAEGQQAFNKYFDALPVFWDRIYPQGGETLYCGESFGAYHGRSINIEHVFPMAWGHAR